MALNVLTAILMLMAIAPFGANAQGLTLSLRIKIFPGDDLVMFADVNADGLVSLPEMADYLGSFGITTTPDRIARFDLNNDTFLSSAELDDALLRAGKNLIKSMDNNDDGRLSLKEVGERINLQPSDDLLHLVDVISDRYLTKEEVDNVPPEMVSLMRKIPQAVAHKLERYLSNASVFVEKVIRNGVEDNPDDTNEADLKDSQPSIGTGPRDENKTSEKTRQFFEGENSDIFVGSDETSDFDPSSYLKGFSHRLARLWRSLLDRFTDVRNWFYQTTGL